jgi:two-component system, OmpR family, phosphate regulon sensor histidine kinase PhoR
MADSGDPADEVERPLRTLRQEVIRFRILRWLALALALMLLALAPFSVWPGVAGLLSLGLTGLILLAWKPMDRFSVRAYVPHVSGRSQAEIRVNTALDAILSPAVLIDPRGNVIHANSSARAAFSGLRQGHSITSAIRMPTMITALEQVLHGQDEVRTQIVEHIPVERSFDVFLRRLAVPTASEQIRGMPYAAVFMMETTSARRIEAMRVDFVANASHELRTPLASILGFIETLQGPAREDAEARKSFLGIMETQARRMARLIEDLLSLSKFEMKAHIVPTELVDVRLLLHSVLDALGELARARNVVLRLETAEAPAMIIGDRDEVERVFENLIENAIKYGQSGGRVEISLARIQDAALGEAISVRVRDYGPGIAEEHLPRLTERFYRADVNESRVLGGTGLGLAIVKHIITRHRGRMAIASKLGEGATFTVIFPASGK